MRDDEDRGSSQLSMLERAAIEELGSASDRLSRLERLLIAAIIELGRQETGEVTDTVDLPYVGGLTPREKEVLQLVVEGHTSKSAGATLGISARTVQVHRMRIMKKLGVRSSAELVYAIIGCAPTKARESGRFGL